MKKIFLSFLVLLNLCFSATEETLDIKINQEVRFGDGFGQITGYPQNITKDLRDKIKFIGEYNLEQNTGNLTIRFKRVQYDGKIYELTEGFEKKLRLKRPQTAKIKDGAQIKVTGGSREEILDIVNQKKQALAKSEENNINKELSRDDAKGGEGNLASILGNASRQTTKDSNYPYYYNLDSKSGNGAGNYSNATTNSDGTCKSPSISGNIVNVYTTSSSGGACKLFTAPASSVYYKANTASCQNKVDYENLKIQVGKEGFVTLDDNKEYKVTACQYSAPIKMEREIGQCRAIANYKDKTAQLQKQYFYIEKNTRHDVGGCVPTEEIVSIQENLNKCGYRHDFVRALSMKQTQFYYQADNKVYEIGECVDKDQEGFRFSHYEDDSTCQYQEIDGRVVYQRRVAFDGLNGGREYATDCRVVSSGGLEIKEELAGYVYYDNIKQAQRKVNQYFIIPQTHTKKYINKNVLTDKIYPYKTSFCKWENNDQEKISIRYSKVFFEDIDERKEVIVSDCSDTIGLNIVPYVYLGEERKIIAEQLKGKTLIPNQDGTKWKIYNTDEWISNTPSMFRTQVMSFNTSGTCRADPRIKSFTQEKWAGLNLREENKSHCERLTGTQNAGDCSYSYWTECRITQKPNHATDQILEKTEIKETWRRGDGSKYQPEIRFEWRAK